LQRPTTGRKKRKEIKRKEEVKEKKKKEIEAEYSIRGRDEGLEASAAKGTGRRRPRF